MIITFLLSFFVSCSETNQFVHNTRNSTHNFQAPKVTCR